MKETFVSVKARKERNEEEKEDICECEGKKRKK
jgi:hypothetical protein